MTNFNLEKYSIVFQLSIWFAGIENPGYSEGRGGDTESIAVSMTLSSEDLLSQVFSEAMGKGLIGIRNFVMKKGEGDRHRCHCRIYHTCRKGMIK